MIPPSQLNLFEFYRDVTLRFQKQHLGISMDRDRHDALHTHLHAVQKSYWDGLPPKYDCSDTIISYGLHFAPKHAVIWRTIGRRMRAAKDQVSWELNSIGTGPGSEIFGLLCGIPNVEKIKISFVGLDREVAWDPLFEIALEEFRSRTGVDIDGFLTNDPKNLLPGGQVIGSLVLSEAMKQGQAIDLMKGIRDVTTSTKAMFLDFNYAIEVSPNEKKFIDNVLRHGGFPTDPAKLREDLSLAEEIRLEMKNCSPLFCKRKINDKLPLTLFTVQLR